MQQSDFVDLSHEQYGVNVIDIITTSVGGGAVGRGSWKRVKSRHVLWTCISRGDPAWKSRK